MKMLVENISNEAFLFKALNDGLRLDGRCINDLRKIKFNFHQQFGQVEVSLGQTVVLCVVTSELVEPYSDRPNEGFLSVQFGASDYSLENDGSNTTTIEAAEICIIIERLLRGCRAIDVESLCILGAHAVWAIRVNLRVINNDGNVRDACAIASIAALSHFRLQEVQIKNNKVTVIPEEEAEAMPLCVHHIPFMVSVGLFDGLEDVFVVDPSHLEESLMSGRISIALNQFGELCALHKPGGKSVSFKSLQECLQVVCRAERIISAAFHEAFKVDAERRKQFRRNIRQPYAASTIVITMPNIVDASMRLKRNFEDSDYQQTTAGGMHEAVIAETHLDAAFMMHPINDTTTSPPTNTSPPTSTSPPTNTSPPSTSLLTSPPTNTSAPSTSPPTAPPINAPAAAPAPQITSHISMVDDLCEETQEFEAALTKRKKMKSSKK